MVKRVWALYRVSDAKQVTDKNDIPMQENAVRKFLSDKSDWKLTKELSELGISGFKKSVEERDKIQLIKKGADNKEFDVLVVFMADRLGRNKHEIPFMLDYLSNKGVEVWSTVEGLLNDPSHENSLITYIRYWQAEGESKKISIRVRERIKQMKEENLWTGGVAPYGYEIYETDIKHPKKDQKIKDYRINKEEAEVIRLIFNLVIDKGYGSGRITQILNERNLKPRRAKIWRQNAISRILRNSIYCGYRRYNLYTTDDKQIKIRDKSEWKKQSFNPEFQIITEDTFVKVQKIIDQRKSNKRNDKEPRVTKSDFLFSGIAYCGYCNNKLKVDYVIKKKLLKNGNIYKYIQKRYCCHFGKNKREGHETVYFAAIKYESKAEKIVLSHLKNNDLAKLVNEKMKYEKEKVNINSERVKNLERNKNNLETELNVLKNEVINALLGKSKFNSDLLSSLIEEKEIEIQKLESSIDSLRKQMTDQIDEKKLYEEISETLNNWEERYFKNDLDGKKVMMAALLDRVIFKKDSIEIKLGQSFI